MSKIASLAARFERRASNEDSSIAPLPGVTRKPSENSRFPVEEKPWIGGARRSSHDEAEGSRDEGLMDEKQLEAPPREESPSELVSTSAVVLDDLMGESNGFSPELSSSSNPFQSDLSPLNPTPSSWAAAPHPTGAALKPSRGHADEELDLDELEAFVADGLDGEGSTDEVQSEHQSLQPEQEVVFYDDEGLEEEDDEDSDDGDLWGLGGTVAAHPPVAEEAPGQEQGEEGKQEEEEEGKQEEEEEGKQAASPPPVSSGRPAFNSLGAGDEEFEVSDDESDEGGVLLPPEEGSGRHSGLEDNSATAAALADEEFDVEDLSEEDEGVVLPLEVCAGIRGGGGGGDPQGIMQEQYSEEQHHQHHHVEEEQEVKKGLEENSRTSAAVADEEFDAEDLSEEDEGVELPEEASKGLRGGGGGDHRGILQEHYHLNNEEEGVPSGRSMGVVSLGHEEEFGAEFGEEGGGYGVDLDTSMTQEMMWGGRGGGSGATPEAAVVVQNLAQRLSMASPGAEQDQSPQFDPAFADELRRLQMTSPLEEEDQEKEEELRAEGGHGQDEEQEPFPYPEEPAGGPDEAAQDEEVDFKDEDDEDAVSIDSREALDLLGDGGAGADEGSEDGEDEVQGQLLSGPTQPEEEQEEEIYTPTPEEDVVEGEPKEAAAAPEEPPSFTPPPPPSHKVVATANEADDDKEEIIDEDIIDEDLELSDAESHGSSPGPKGQQEEDEEQEAPAAGVTASASDVPLELSPSAGSGSRGLSDLPLEVSVSPEDAGANKEIESPAAGLGNGTAPLPHGVAETDEAESKLSAPVAVNQEDAQAGGEQEEDKEDGNFLPLTEATKKQLDAANGDHHAADGAQEEPQAAGKQAMWLPAGQWAAGGGARGDDDGIYEEFHDELDEEGGDGGSDATPCDGPVTPNPKTVARIDGWWDLNGRVKERESKAMEATKGKEQPLKVKPAPPGWKPRQPSDYEAELSEILKQFTMVVLQEQPEDVAMFACRYFQAAHLEVLEGSGGGAAEMES